MAFALALPLSHVANLVIPFPSVRGGSPAELAALAIATLVPDDSLRPVRRRRHAGPDADARRRLACCTALICSARPLGCLAIIWLLERTDITSTALAAAGAAAHRRGVLRQVRRARGYAAAALAVAALRRVRPQRDGRPSAGRDLSEEPQPVGRRARHRLLGVECPLQRNRPCTRRWVRRFSGARRPTRPRAR